MNDFEKGLLDLIFSLEGGASDLKGDSGGWTYKGVSSRYYPEIKTMYESRDPNIDDYVESIYLTGYIRSIFGYEELVPTYPWLVKLLVPAKVHGSGDEDLVELVQRRLVDFGYAIIVDGQLGPKTLDALLSLSGEQKLALKSSIQSSQAILAESRVQAVGGYRNGVLNRVRDEFLNAFDDEDPSTYLGNDSVQTAALSIKVDPGSPVVVSSDGWEDLPLGLDLTIEIRNSAYASNSISTKGSIRTERS